MERCKSPEYPTRSELFAQGDGLPGRLPARWRFGRDLAGAAAMLLAANLAGCGAPPPDPVQALGEGTPEVLGEADVSVDVSEGGVISPTILDEADEWVDSIFDDGSGPFMLGCVAMMPPAYIPEERVQQILNDVPPPEAPQPPA